MFTQNSVVRIIFKLEISKPGNCMRLRLNKHLNFVFMTFTLNRNIRNRFSKVLKNFALKLFFVICLKMKATKIKIIAKI